MEMPRPQSDCQCLEGQSWNHSGIYFVLSIPEMTPLTFAIKLRLSIELLPMINVIYEKGRNGNISF